METAEPAWIHVSADPFQSPKEISTGGDVNVPHDGDIDQAFQSPKEISTGGDPPINRAD